MDHLWLNGRRRLNIIKASLGTFLITLGVIEAGHIQCEVRVCDSRLRELVPFLLQSPLRTENVRTRSVCRRGEELLLMSKATFRLVWRGTPKLLQVVFNKRSNNPHSVLGIFLVLLGELTNGERLVFLKRTLRLNLGNSLRCACLPGCFYWTPLGDYLLIVKLINCCRCFLIVADPRRARTCWVLSGAEPVGLKSPLPHHFSLKRLLLFGDPLLIVGVTQRQVRVVCFPSGMRLLLKE